AFTGRRPVYLDGKFRPMPTYARTGLAASNRISGPALIEEHAATTLLWPGDRLEVDVHGHLMIEVAGGRKTGRQKKEKQEKRTGAPARKRGGPTTTPPREHESG